jgi:bifunctional non-homologous end joining protein LigD
MPDRDPSVDPLERYWSKRDFAVTAEPRGERKDGTSQALSFVIQKHAASRLHYDLRLELDGVLLSWAVPKGPSFDPSEKRMAIHVEDHPLSYGAFEGTIPPKQYGAGTVIVWDNGTWEPVGDPREGLAKGKLLFHLHGQKLAGLWELVKIAKGGEKQEPWILFKKRDGFARPKSEYDVVSALPDSVIAKPLKKAPVGAGAPETARKPGRKDRTDKGLPGAVKAPLPAKMDPQLATLATGVPASGDWVYEINTTGRRRCRVSCATWSASASGRPGSMARLSCSTHKACRSSTPFRTRSTERRAPSRSSTSSSTCRTSRATTCGNRLSVRAGNSWTNSSRSEARIGFDSARPSMPIRRRS